MSNDMVLNATLVTKSTNSTNSQGFTGGKHRDVYTGILLKSQHHSPTIIILELQTSHVFDIQSFETVF